MCPESTNQNPGRTLILEIEVPGISIDDLVEFSEKHPEEEGDLWTWLCEEVHSECGIVVNCATENGPIPSAHDAFIVGARAKEARP